MNETISEWAIPCVKLLQGPVYEEDTSVWKILLTWQTRVSEYFAAIGLSLFLDQAEGYAFLTQAEEEDGETVGSLPRLVRKIPLTFEMSLLCIILREALEHFDSSQNESSILVMRSSEIKELVSVYLKEKTDQTRLYRDLERYINQAVDLTFLRELKESRTDMPDRIFEVRRILRAKIDTQFLEDFKREMERYLDGN
jgi:hypothetical protein